VHIVALTEVAQPTDAALAPVAAVVGSSAYDVRLILNGGLPAVVLVTDDGARAARVVAELALQGHRAFTCDRASITPSAKMTAIRVIDFGPDGIAPAEGLRERFPYSDILCILRATHAKTTEVVSQVKERKLRPGMAIATGGLIMTKTTSREVRSTEEQRQQALYIFRRNGQAPWILRERETNYSGLGSKLAPSAVQNFATAIQELRALAPQAAYDERLLKSRPVRGVNAGIEAVDVCAHILAADLAERAMRLRE